MAEETYYSLLEVSETASTTEIRAAYRRLITEVHPDRLANAPAYWQNKAEETTKEINEAFRVLSNPERRRLYDARLCANRASKDKSGAAAYERHSPSAPQGPGRQQSQESVRQPSSSGSNYGTTPHSSPGDRRGQDNPGSTKAPSSPRRPTGPTPAIGMTSAARTSWSLTLAFFGFGSAVNFWGANSAGHGLLSFLLSGALLFGLALLNHSWIARLFRLAHLRAPRYQLLAIIGSITIFLFVGKFAYLPQYGASSRQVLRSDPSEGATSPSPANSSVSRSSAPSGQTDIQVSLPNGTEILKRRRNGGHGKFTVENGTAFDAVVALVDVDTKKAILAFYVPAGEEFTEQQISPGRYNIIYTTGLGWDASRRRFSRSGETGIFDQTAMFSEQRNEETGEIDFQEFRVTLNPVEGGTARTSELGVDAFEKAILQGDLQ